jgi:hypothetical protein
MKTKFLPLISLLLLFSCQKENIKNTESSIIKMSFDFGEVTFEENEGTINAPEDTELKSLIPTIEISDGAEVYPPSKTIMDFTEPVSYSVSSEDQQNQTYYTISVFLPLVKFSVLDCSNCTSSNPIPQKANNATIKIFKESNDSMKELFELTTNEEGEVLFYADPNEIYYGIVEKGNAKFTKDGYLIVGIFQDEEDLYAHSYYLPDAQIGDLITIDLNGDGLLNADDKIEYLSVWNKEYHEETIERTIYISD